MARKSRKNIQETKILSNKKIYYVGVYLRLSRLDSNKNDSDTIENQKNLILNYIKEKDDLKLFKIYEDTNFTGTNFERDNFENLLEDIKLGKINCIIVKDLSRFGRNYVECGNYLEKIFPFMNVRFIAINDNYDSENENAKDILVMHLKNIVNEMYAKDISKKVSTVLTEKRKNGEFIGAWARYGYLKDTNNKNKIIINEETAPIVEKIFNLRLQNYSYNKIAILLNEENILSPYAYLYKIGTLKNEKFKNTKWSVTNIKEILSNEIYIGNMVQGRKKTDLSKNQKQKLMKSADWIIAYDTHNPIIDKDIFYKVQEINKNATEKYNLINKNRLIKKTTENIFKGIIKCGCCGRNLFRKEEIKKNSKSRDTYKFFQCNYRKIKECDFTIINEDVIKEVIFQDVKKQIDIAINLENIIKKNYKFIFSEEMYLNNEIKKIENEIIKVHNFYKNIYEDYVRNILTEEDYILIKNSYLEKENNLKQKKIELEIKLSKLTANLIKQNKYISQFLKFKNNRVLTKDLIESLIKEIVVYKDKTIQITFNYINEYKDTINEIERVLKNGI